MDTFARVTRRRRVARAAAFACVIAAAACGERVYDFTLRFVEIGDLGPSGFNCKDSAGQRYLAERAYDPASERIALSVVVDIFRLAGAPYCRGIDIVAYCRSAPGNCALDLSQRRCFPITLEDAGPPSMALVRRTLDQLARENVTRAAPDTVLIVRVVGTTASCSEIAAGGPGFACGRLVGCATSCPVYLPKLEAEVGDGALDLGLDVRNCDEKAVAICAAADLTSEDDACSSAD